MATTETKPRIEPLRPPYEPAIAATLAKWMPPGSDLEPLVLFRLLAVHDELFSRSLPLGAGILGHGRITPLEREIVIHRTCALAGAEYEWGVHAVAFAADVGLTDEQLAATVHGRADDPAWSPADSAIVALCDELFYTATVSGEVWDGVAATHSPDQMLELVIAAGWYRTLCGVINATQIPLEPWAARFPAA
jgi:4-carboxymuconolactone decarboxylase